MRLCRVRSTKKCLALASWCAAIGGIREVEGPYPG